MKIFDMRDYCREDFDALTRLYQRSKGDEFRFQSGWPSASRLYRYLVMNIV